MTAVSKRTISGYASVRKHEFQGVARGCCVAPSLRALLARGAHVACGCASSFRAMLAHAEKRCWTTERTPRSELVYGPDKNSDLRVCANINYVNTALNSNEQGTY